MPRAYNNKRQGRVSTADLCSGCRPVLMTSLRLPCLTQAHCAQEVAQAVEQLQAAFGQAGGECCPSAKHKGEIFCSSSGIGRTKYSEYLIGQNPSVSCKRFWPKRGLCLRAYLKP